MTLPVDSETTLQREAPAAATKPAIPGAVWLLGLVSLLTDISSEMIFAVLPVYLSTVMGMPMAVIGLIEGLAEATAAIVKIFAGLLADRWGRCRGLIVFGYALSAATKIVFPLAGVAAPIFAARIVDRVGKGLRTAPRDALIARVSPLAIRGKCFGVRQTLDSVGAVIGPLIAIVVMGWTGGDFTSVFWIAVLPGLLAVAVVVHLKEAPAPLPLANAVLGRSGFAALGPMFWWITTLAVVMTLGRGAKAFLVLRTENVGTALWLVPLVFVIMNLVYALVAFPAGLLADRMNRHRLLTSGIALLVASDLILTLADRPWVVLAGVLLWGLHFGVTQGLLATLIADAVPDARHGTAFGIFNFASGFAMVAAGAGGGVVWDLWGPSALFAAGLAASLLAFALSLRPPMGRSPTERAGSSTAGPAPVPRP